MSDIDDRTVSMNAVLAYTLWVLGIGLVVVHVVTGLRTAQMGLLVAMAGCVLNVRGYFVCLRDREQAAFDLGRESAQSGAGVRTIT